MTAKIRRATRTIFRESGLTRCITASSQSIISTTLNHIMKTSHKILALSLGLAALSTYGADAATNWTDQCAKCHGADGKGETKMGKKLGIADLTDAKVQAAFTDEVAFNAVKEGLKDKDGKVTMKAIEGLTDDDIKALIPVIRAFKK